MTQARKPTTSEVVAVLGAGPDTWVEVADVGAVADVPPPDAVGAQFLQRDRQTRGVTTLPIEDVEVLNKKRTPVS